MLTSIIPTPTETTPKTPNPKEIYVSGINSEIKRLKDRDPSSQRQTEQITHLIGIRDLASMANSKKEYEELKTLQEKYQEYYIDPKEDLNTPKLLEYDAYTGTDETPKTPENVQYEDIENVTLKPESEEKFPL